MFSRFFSKVTPPDLVIFRPKNEILDFGHFIASGVLISSGIAYSERTECLEVIRGLRTKQLMKWRSESSQKIEETKKLKKSESQRSLKSWKSIRDQ